MADNKLPCSLGNSPTRAPWQYLPDARFLHIFPYRDTGPDRHVYWDRVHTMAAVYNGMLKTGGDDTPIPSMDELAHLCRTLHDMNFLASAYFTA
ncbi:hypothetical protein F4802DRAFT_598673 [Xylaria palmicola]|nr:hypothetical protein F4802DRAFT_598673 [Xylaria palmicola]